MRVAPDREVTIYALKREGQAAPYYIGQTVNAAKRRSQHGVKPSEFIELEKVPATEAHSTEREWVHRALALGITLRNDHYNTLKKREYPVCPTVAFTHAPSGVLYCRLNLKQGGEIIAGYSLRCDAKKGDPVSMWQAIKKMQFWLKEMGCPELAIRPHEWAQQRVNAGKFPQCPRYPLPC
jgi:hypothetical protein